MSEGMTTIVAHAGCLDYWHVAPLRNQRASTLRRSIEVNFRTFHPEWILRFQPTTIYNSDAATLGRPACYSLCVKKRKKHE